MDEKRKTRRNTLQNFLIALLSITAALLLVQLLYVGSDSQSLLDRFLAPSAAAQTTEAAALTDLSAPVRVAVTGPYGRYGALSLATNDKDFSALGGLLREALGSAGTPESCAESDFRAALAAPGVCYDFCSTLPLSVLSGLVGASSGLSGSARRLVLFSADGRVQLCYADGSAFYRCATAAPLSELSDTVSSYQLGNAAFAFELDGAANLNPYSLVITGDLPDYPVLAASTPAADTSAILSALGFNPHTNSRYTDAGTEVVVDGGRSVRIRADGVILYQDGDGALPLPGSGGDTLSDADLVVGCYRLLTSVLGDGGGSAVLCPRSVTRSGGSAVVRFDYQVDGTLVADAAGLPAAEVTVSGSSVAALRLRVRKYEPTEQTGLLLPLRQTLAIAAAYSGAELELRYTDGGGSSLTAGWVAG